MTMTDSLGRWTSREILEFVGGEKHALHTVISKTREPGQITFKCSCGAKAIVSSKQLYKEALRNVLEEGHDEFEMIAELRQRLQQLGA